MVASVERRLKGDRARAAAALKDFETPEFAGAAVAALAARPAAAMARTGKVLLTTELAAEFGFTDTDGTRPNSHPPGLREQLARPPEHWVLSKL